MASQPSKSRRSLTACHHGLPGGFPSSGPRTPRSACQRMNDTAARLNGRCRGARPSGPRYVRASSAIRPAGSSRTRATCAAAQSTAMSSRVMHDRHSNSVTALAAASARRRHPRRRDLTWPARYYPGERQHAGRGAGESWVAGAGKQSRIGRGIRDCATGLARAGTVGSAISKRSVVLPTLTTPRAAAQHQHHDPLHAHAPHTHGKAPCKLPCECECAVCEEGQRILGMTIARRLDRGIRNSSYP